MSQSLSRAAGRSLQLILGIWGMLGTPWGHCAGDTSPFPSQAAGGWPQLLAYPMDNRCIGDRQQMGHTTVAHPGHRGHKEEMSPPLSHKAAWRPGPWLGVKTTGTLGACWGYNKDTTEVSPEGLEADGYGHQLILGTRDNLKTCWSYATTLGILLCWGHTPIPVPVPSLPWG